MLDDNNFYKQMYFINMDGNKKKKKDEGVSTFTTIVVYAVIGGIGWAIYAFVKSVLG